MVEVGSITIGGEIETEGIERGLKRVEDGFKDVERVGQGVNSDFTRMNSQAKNLARTLGTMAIVGAGAMIAMAKGAPATAGAMAKIEVGAMKLQFAVGDALKEEFNWFADKLNWLSTWVGSNPDLFGSLTKGVLIFAAAFTAFKVGGLLVAGLGNVASLVATIAGVVSSPIFLAGLGALALAGAAWGYASGLAEQSKAYNAVGSDVFQNPTQGALGQEGQGTRVTEQRSFEFNVKDFYDYKESQKDIQTQTFEWDDIR